MYTSTINDLMNDVDRTQNINMAQCSILIWPHCMFSKLYLPIHLAIESATVPQGYLFPKGTSVENFHWEDTLIVHEHAWIWKNASMVRVFERCSVIVYVVYPHCWTICSRWGEILHGSRTHFMQEINYSKVKSPPSRFNVFIFMND